VDRDGKRICAWYIQFRSDSAFNPQPKNCIFCETKPLSGWTDGNGVMVSTTSTRRRGTSSFRMINQLYYSDTGRFYTRTPRDESVDLYLDPLF
jgi:hypothetical protein